MVSITYGSTTLYTASDTAYEYAGGVGVPVTQTVAPAGIALASNESFEARGNRTTSPAFTVRRLFSSVEAAELFCHDLAAALPTSGDLVFTYAAGVVRRYSGAVYTSATAQQSPTQGMIVSIAYQFAAGPAANS